MANLPVPRNRDLERAELADLFRVWRATMEADDFPAQQAANWAFCTKFADYVNTAPDDDALAQVGATWNSLGGLVMDLLEAGRIDDVIALGESRCWPSFNQVARLLGLEADEA